MVIGFLIRHRVLFSYYFYRLRRKVGWGFGLSGLWIVLGNALVGSLLAWIILAKRTREMTVRLNTMTMPEFLEARYKNRGIKVFAALVIFIFLIPYSASVYMGLSYLFNQIFGIPYLYAALFICLLTALYLVMGGYRAVAMTMTMTDFFQGLVMVPGVGSHVFWAGRRYYSHDWLIGHACSPAGGAGSEPGYGTASA